MDSTDVAVEHAKSRLERTRDHARTMRLHPPLRVRLSRSLQGLAERLEPGVAARYAAALGERGV